MSNNNEQNLINFDLEIEFNPSSDNHHSLSDIHHLPSDNHYPPSDNQDQVQQKNNNTITLSLDNNFQTIQNNCINIDDPFFDFLEGNIIKTSTPDNLCAQKNANTFKIGEIEENNLNLKSNFCNNNDNNVDSFLYNNISLIPFSSKPTIVNTTTSESDDLIQAELNLNKTIEQNNEQEYNNHSITTCTDLVNLEQSPIKSQTDSNISSILSTEAKQTKTINITNPLKPLSFTVFETSELFDNSFEDIMSIQPAWIDSGSDIDSDLENLKVSILEKLAINDTPLSTPSNNNADDDNDNDGKTKCEEIKDNNKCISNRLEVLKKKIELEKQKQNDKKNVTTLISDLKDIILECSNEDKKKTANDLLESLETLLNNSTENHSHNKNDDNNNKNKKCDENIEKNNGFIVPKIIVKQETFDVDEGNRCSTDSNVNENEKVKQNVASETEVNNQNDSSDSSNNNIVIIKGAAQNIVQQIDKILKDQDIKSSNECNNSSNLNPTFVFVLSGTPNTLIRQTSEIFNRKNISEKDEKHINNDDDDNNDGNSTPYRRRSLSLTDIRKHTIKNSQILDNFKTPKRPIIASDDDQKMIKTTPILKNVENNRKKFLHTEDNKVAKIAMRRSLNIFSNNNGSSNNNSNNIGNDQKKNGFNSKLRIKSNDLYNNQKPSGPIKATVPIIKVAPIMAEQSNGSGSGSRSKQIQQPFTSTPIQSNNNNNLIQNQKRISFNSQNNNNCNSKLKRRSFSPVKNSRSRDSYHPTTKSSNSKPEVINYDSPLSNNKRKSFAETVNKLTPSKMGTQTLRQGKLKGIQQQGNNKENTPNPKKK